MAQGGVGAAAVSERPPRCADALREAEFRTYFETQSIKPRAELRIVLLVSMACLIAFHRVFLDLSPEVVPLGKALILGVMLPAILCWMSARGSPFHRWSTQLYIVAAFVDIACLLLLRVACIKGGFEVVPLLLPIAVLLSLVVVQIPFVQLLPVVLVGLGCIVGVELWAFEMTSNRLFQLAAAIALVLVALSSAYGIERWMRLGWQRRRQLSEIAAVDELTGLASRCSFEERFPETLRAARRARRSVTLMILDVDQFKAFNESLGHPAGDECLKKVGNYLGAAMRRPLDFAARLGGEEFAAVWFDATWDDAAQLAEKLRQGVGALDIPAPSKVGGSVSASAGLTYVDSPSRHVAACEIAAEMIRNADTALYRAKRTNRNQLCVVTR